MKKNSIIAGVIIILIFAMSILYISFHFNIFKKVGTKISEYEAAKKENEEYSYRHEDLSVCNEIEPITDEPDAWYTKYHFISHAGGGIDGKSYSNSIQAWELSYERGNRLFDADLAFTSDGVLVLRHGWNDNLGQNIAIKDGNPPYIDRNGQIRYLDYSSERMNFDSFMNTKVYHKYDPMSCMDMFNFMIEHDDVYVMCDMKDDLSDSYQYLVQTAIDKGMPELLDRIVVSIYNYDDLQTINNIYKFEEIMIRQYINSPHKYSELLQICKENDIHAVSISACYADDEGISQLANHNIHIYVAICDYISDMQVYTELGINGAVSNFLYEDDWKYVSKTE